MDSNETLYGGDPKFLSELNRLCETLIGQILDHLKTLGGDEVRTKKKMQHFCYCCTFLLMHSERRFYKLPVGSDCIDVQTVHHHFASSPQHYVDVFLTLLQHSTRRQGTLAFSLFSVLLAHGDLRNNKLSQLAVNLWNLSHKHGYCDTRVSVS